MISFFFSSEAESYHLLEACGSGKASRIHQRDRCSCPCELWWPWWCKGSRHPQSPKREEERKVLTINWSQDGCSCSDGEAGEAANELNQLWHNKAAVCKPKTTTTKSCNLPHYLVKVQGIWSQKKMNKQIIGIFQPQEGKIKCFLVKSNVYKHVNEQE